MRQEGNQTWFSPDEANFVKQVCSHESHNPAAQAIADRTREAIVDWANTEASDLPAPTSPEPTGVPPYALIHARMKYANSTMEVIVIPVTDDERVIIKQLAGKHVALLLEKAGTFGPEYDAMYVLNALCALGTDSASASADEIESFKSVIFEGDLRLLAVGQAVVAGCDSGSHLTS